MNRDHGEEDDNPLNGSGGIAEASRYISESLAELITIAGRHRLHTLGYLLRMARLEALDAGNADDTAS